MDRYSASHFASSPSTWSFTEWHCWHCASGTERNPCSVISRTFTYQKRFFRLSWKLNIFFRIQIQIFKLWISKSERLWCHVPSFEPASMSHCSINTDFSVISNLLKVPLGRKFIGLFPPNSVAEYRVLFIFSQKTEQQTFHPNIL